MQDIAEFDFPAIFDEVLKHNNKKMILIGHSQGSAAILASLIEKPKYQEHVDKVINLASAITLHNAHEINPMLYYGLRVL